MLSTLILSGARTFCTEELMACTDITEAAILMVCVVGHEVRNVALMLSSLHCQILLFINAQRPTTMTPIIIFEHVRSNVIMLPLCQMQHISEPVDYQAASIVSHIIFTWHTNATYSPPHKLMCLTRDTVHMYTQARLLTPAEL